jgi:hypothetical protein
MADEKFLAKRKKFKTISTRKLSSSDVELLHFLWRWKVATTSLLKEFIYPKKSFWWVYKSIRQLKAEKLIELLPRGKRLEQELWALTDRGFELVLQDRDDIDKYRYRVHAPAHDYLATCLQLGEFWHLPFDYSFHTEQMMSSLSDSNLHKRVNERHEHIPDGATFLFANGKEALICYEVDLTLKDEDRYNKTHTFYELGAKPDLIVWLVSESWILNRIAGILSKQSLHGLGETYDQTAFVLLDDFKQNVWNAKCCHGPLAGNTIRKLHANVIQKIGKEEPKIRQRPYREIYFPKFKSPQKLASCVNQAKQANT